MPHTRRDRYNTWVLFELSDLNYEDGIFGSVDLGVLFPKQARCTQPDWRVEIKVYVRQKV